MEATNQIENYPFVAEWLSESVLSLRFEPPQINEQLSEYIIYIGKRLEHFKWVQDIVPSYHTLSIFIDRREANSYFCPKPYYEAITSFLNELLVALPLQPPNVSEKTIKEIPVVYDGEDLLEVATLTNLTAEEVIALHTQPLYRVYLLGFLPGFAYLGGLLPQLQVPRKSTPRLSIKAGSVGIAGQQTGIYPIVSPGGWQIIGHTQQPLFDASANPLTFLQAGDYVKFIRI